MSEEKNVIDNPGLIRTVDRFQTLQADREQRLIDFSERRRFYLIHQELFHMPIFFCRTPEESFKANIECVAANLDIPSDHIPFMEPWFGTGVYANIYGCPYFWREEEAPAVRYRYHSLDEVQGLPKPNWKDSEIAQLVVETIRHFKSRTGDAVPIVWTDTQSASDTATLILDATEILAACLDQPDTVMDFLQNINEVVVEFSKVQAGIIGDALASPGHLFVSGPGLGGMSVSDDNIVCSSPAVNSAFNLVLDDQIGRAMGGVAIHSCGDWTHTMPLVKEHVPSCIACDCAVDTSVDPNPNKPEQVRDAFAGTGIPIQVRLTGETEPMLETVRRLLHPDLRLIVWPMPEDALTAERNYEELNALLSGSYDKEN